MSDDARLSLLLEAVDRGYPQEMIAWGESMLPALAPGSRLRLVPPKKIDLGDIVAVWPQGAAFLIHRVVGLRANGGLLLKGDNNPRPDGWFRRHQIRALVEPAS